MELLKTLDKIRKLPVKDLAVFLGSLAVIVGVLLPWYRDTDQFQTGTMFLGINGPLYLAGILAGLAGIFSLIAQTIKMRGGSLDALPVKENHLYVMSGVVVLLMVVMAASVYFHPKFGINLANKEAGFGMILAALGGGTVLAGGLFTLRKRANEMVILDAHREHLDELETENRRPAGLGVDMTVEEAMKMNQSIDEFIK